MLNTIDSKTRMLDVIEVRSHFPILHQKIHQQPLVYFDNAATTQKPRYVLTKMADYYSYDNANIHRGVHTLSVRATEAYERSRSLAATFINARFDHEVIFTSGATESINLIAQSFGRSNLNMGDEIILSEMEHHSNIVPWQMVCEAVGASIKVIPINDAGEIELDVYRKLLSPKTKLVAITHISNAIGTINPIEKIIDIAHEKNIPVLIDGAQAAAHQTIDVQKLNCDFYVISAHKMYGPTGVGLLYGKSEWLERLPPYQGGGDMITEVSFNKTRYNKLPHKFEAGTPNIAGVIGFGASIEYLNSIGMTIVAAHEHGLLTYATNVLNNIDGIEIIGTAKNKAAVISFKVADIHPHDVGTILDHEGIAIRAGHHCAMPLMARYNVPATARVSFGIYNSTEEIDKLADALLKLKRVFNVS